MIGQPRYPRLLPDLLNALRRHLRLLKEFSTLAFEEGKQDYFGEVGGKLRLLVCKAGNRDRPLLIDLMSEFEVDIPLPDELYPPVQHRPRNLQEFLASRAFFIAGKEAVIDLTYEQLISAWANQSGAAHEDWEWTREFTADRHIGLLLFGHPPAVVALREAAHTVIYFAEAFLLALTDDVIREKAARYALRVTERALRDFPSDEVPIRHVRAKELCLLGNFEESLRECELIIVRNRTDGAAHHRRGMALLLLERAREAAASFMRALRMGYESGELHYNLACALSVLGKLSRCLQHLQQVERLGDFPVECDLTEDPDFTNIRSDPTFGSDFRTIASRLRSAMKASGASQAGHDERS